jgi:hypothetical protein
MRVSRGENERTAQQFNGREGETATFLFSLSVFLDVACWRFRPTSSGAVGRFRVKI